MKSFLWKRTFEDSTKQSLSQSPLIKNNSDQNYGTLLQIKSQNESSEVFFYDNKKNSIPPRDQRRKSKSFNNDIKFKLMANTHFEELKIPINNIDFSPQSLTKTPQFPTVEETFTYSAF